MDHILPAPHILCWLFLIYPPQYLQSLSLSLWSNLFCPFSGSVLPPWDNPLVSAHRRLPRCHVPPSHTQLLCFPLRPATNWSHHNKYNLVPTAPPHKSMGLSTRELSRPPFRALPHAFDLPRNVLLPPSCLYRNVLLPRHRSTCYMDFSIRVDIHYYISFRYTA